MARLGRRIPVSSYLDYQKTKLVFSQVVIDVAAGAGFNNGASFILPAKAKTTVLVFVDTDRAPATLAITVGGVTPNLLVTNGNLKVWFIQITAASPTVSYSANANQGYIGAVSYTGVSTVSVINNTSGTSTSPSNSVTSSSVPVNGMAVCGMGHSTIFGGVSMTGVSGGTNRLFGPTAASGGASLAISDAFGPTNTTFQATLSGSLPWYATSVLLNPNPSVLPAAIPAPETYYKEPSAQTPAPASISMMTRSRLY